MHINTARRLAQDLELRLEDPDLAYFVEGTPEFGAYITDMLWSQEYARANRDQMMDNALREVFAVLGHGAETQRINCHHNFTQREVHDGHELWITRKGAIKAGTGDLGVIPGSMGARSYIGNSKGQCSELDVVLARRRPPLQPHEGEEALQHDRPGRADEHPASGSQLQGNVRLGPARPRAGRDTCAGEVLKEGRSVRTGEAAGSIPAAGSARYSGEPAVSKL